MPSRILKIVLTGALLGASLAVPAAAERDKVKTWTLKQAQPMKSRAGRLTARAPDLRPIVKSPFNGVVRVKNVGSATAGVSYVTVRCNRLGRRGGCPEARGMGAYENPAYPNKAAIKVPKLAPGKTFTHKLKFWNSLSFGPGTYQFTVIADDGNKVAETNEGNNTVVTKLVAP